MNHKRHGRNLVITEWRTHLEIDNKGINSIDVYYMSVWSAVRGQDSVEARYGFKPFETERNSSSWVHELGQSLAWVLTARHITKK